MQEEGLAVPDGCTAPESHKPWTSFRPTLSFQWQYWGLHRFCTSPRSAAHHWCVLRIPWNEEHAWNTGRCCRTGFVSQSTDVSFITHATSYCSVGHSSIYLIFYLSQSPWNQQLRKWAEPYINLSVIRVCFFPVNPHLLPGCWWNIPENDLQTNAAGSALLLPTWNTFGVPVIYLLKCFWRNRSHW